MRLQVVGFSNIVHSHLNVEACQAMSFDYYDVKRNRRLNLKDMLHLQGFNPKKMNFSGLSARQVAGMVPTSALEWKRNRDNVLGLLKAMLLSKVGNAMSTTVLQAVMRRALIACRLLSSSCMCKPALSDVFR
jgi:hypothetical protein